jgi:hypothetical protein
MYAAPSEIIEQFARRQLTEDEAEAVYSKMGGE